MIINMIIAIIIDVVMMILLPGLSGCCGVVSGTRGSLSIGQVVLIIIIIITNCLGVGSLSGTVTNVDLKTFWPALSELSCQGVSSVAKG